jgi:hypothetical protein
MRALWLALGLFLIRCGGPCDPPPCSAPMGHEWCVLDEADGGRRVVGSP